MTWLRSRMGLLLLNVCKLAMLAHMGYLAWLFFRWSLIVMPMDAETRRVAVQWWDTRGWLWGYRRYPVTDKAE